MLLKTYYYYFTGRPSQFFPMLSPTELIIKLVSPKGVCIKGFWLILIFRNQRMGVFTIIKYSTVERKIVKMVLV